MKNMTARRTWMTPEILHVVASKHAQVGNDNQTVDQIFPAANGSTVPAS